MLPGKLACVLFAVAVLAVASHARADLVIYADTLHNGFEDWSWGGGSDFANPLPVHAGERSIAFTGNAWNAVSLARPQAPMAITDWASLRLWVHGGSANGQQLSVMLENTGTGASASVPLASHLPGGPVAGTWKEVVVPLAAAFPNLATFDRINLQSASAGTQPTLYLDDIALLAARTDALFANGFDGSGPPPGNGLVIDHDVVIDGLSADRFTWQDSARQPRVALLAHNDGGVGAAGSRGGELRQLRYQVGAATRRVTATADAFGGFGYVVSHPSHEDGAHCTGAGDPSSLGHFHAGNFQRLFTGRHHAIVRFTQSYPRYCTPAGPANHVLAVTIDWLFSTGRDHPLWSVTWDLSGVPVDRLEDDARGPYGQLRIDGAPNDAARALIGGVAWGDYYRFTTTTSPVTFASSWRWDQPNTIPYVKLWSAGVDATMGIVQTRPIAQQDAGGYWGQDAWGRTSAEGDACSGQYRMPCDYNWPFQSINYELYGGPTQNARLAWGTNFGFLGQAQYRIRGNAAYGGGALALPGDPHAAGWPKQSYATWIVLGTHSGDPVGRQVAAMEAVQTATLSATLGSVATQGRRGVADPSTMSYQPAGYDPVYAALTFNAAGNRLTGNIALAGGASVEHPLVVLRGYTGALPATVRLGGVALVRDVDYFPSLRADAGELWITLARSLAGASNSLEIMP
ncbi:hypothetical protein [Dokdonella sp.]|uniref:hypothetical protein n=1 Tax=Dokdonella sp. TaxID=2291710 RepID=UPI0031CB9C46|nr:hypothetical protein [Dokdonella sp.]